jgi:UDP-hydrolysing UDP-N-acetyl-D-glucosamine 2-epimerase
MNTIKKKTKITIITGSRAEWGILKPLCKELEKFPRIDSGLIVTGSNLDPETDNAADEISFANVKVDAWVSIFPDKGLIKNGKERMFCAISNLYKNLPEILMESDPDLVVVLGDRYEIFAVASICRLLGIKLAHISGGELTYGAFDDSLRHAITKLSDYHFCATKEYRKRIIQMGEKPEMVFNFGEPGLHNFDKIPLLSRAQIVQKLDLPEDAFWVLSTLHPETCFPDKISNQINMIVESLLETEPFPIIVFTGANADPEGEIINKKLKELAEKYPKKIYFFQNLGRELYLSVAAQSLAVVGNSSSGIIEIPELKIPVINLGERQKGRPHGKIVLDASLDQKAIKDALKIAFSQKFRKDMLEFRNPYHGKNSVTLIAEKLVEISDCNSLRTKEFYDLP